MNSNTALTILAASEFRPAEDSSSIRLEQLQPVAERIFGKGDRPKGWFEQKVRRECVDPELSALAIRSTTSLTPNDERKPTNPETHLPPQSEFENELGSVQGYALVGRPPSLPRVARMAGIGVVPAYRDQGIGRALVEHITKRALEADCTSFQALSTPEVRPWYEQQGFYVLRDQITLMHFGQSNSAAPLNAPSSAQPLVPLPTIQWGNQASLSTIEQGQSQGSPRLISLCSWLNEAWTRTAPEKRGHQALVFEGKRVGDAFLSQEGQAFLVQQLLLDEQAITSAEAAKLINHLRDALPNGSPVLLYGCAPADPIIAGLRQSYGWRVVQRSSIMQKPLQTRN